MMCVEMNWRKNGVGHTRVVSAQHSSGACCVLSGGMLGCAAKKRGAL
jgi:hypothetical protein